ncbi:MAG: hypothetical protein LIP16_01020 [Clostridium sp.]|nr:hypothetical protein [Clostridium sp.]
MGHSAVNYVDTRTADITFITCRGIDSNYGITDFIEEESKFCQSIK